MYMCLNQIIGARYVSSALMHAGWVLGCLELVDDSACNSFY